MISFAAYCNRISYSYLFVEAAMFVVYTFFAVALSLAAYVRYRSAGERDRKAYQPVTLRVQDAILRRSRGR